MEEDRIRNNDKDSDKYKIQQEFTILLKENLSIAINSKISIHLYHKIATFLTPAVKNTEILFDDLHDLKLEIIKLIRKYDSDTEIPIRTSQEKSSTLSFFSDETQTSQCSPEKEVDKYSTSPFRSENPLNFSTKSC